MRLKEYKYAPLLPPPQLRFSISAGFSVSAGAWAKTMKWVSHWLALRPQRTFSGPLKAQTPPRPSRKTPVPSEHPLTPGRLCRIRLDEGDRLSSPMNEDSWDVQLLPLPPSPPKAANPTFAPARPPPPLPAPPRETPAKKRARSDGGEEGSGAKRLMVQNGKVGGKLYPPAPKKPPPPPPPGTRRRSA